jgi:hypothetical protein
MLSACKALGFSFPLSTRSPAARDEQRVEFLSQIAHLTQVNELSQSLRLMDELSLS